MREDRKNADSRDQSIISVRAGLYEYQDDKPERRQLNEFRVVHSLYLYCCARLSKSFRYIHSCFSRLIQERCAETINLESSVQVNSVAYRQVIYPDVIESRVVSMAAESVTARTLFGYDCTQLLRRLLNRPQRKKCQGYLLSSL